jgi:biotin synthase-like enzyme
VYFVNNFETILTRALKDELSREEALYILKEVNSIERYLELFRIASRVRGDVVGDVFKFDGFIGSITPCTTNPPCRYCGRSARPETFSDILTPEEVALGVKLVG